VTKPIARLIKSELDWMREAQRDWGHIAVDPYLIMVGRQNSALKRVFDESNLDRNDSDHWKLLLASIAQIVYSPPKPGPGRTVEWTFRLGYELLKDALKLRLEEPKKSVEDIADELARSDKWKERGLVVDRERIQNLLRDVRGRVVGELRSVAKHSEYKLGQRGKLMRDIAWAFSKEGKRELIRRLRSREGNFPTVS